MRRRSGAAASQRCLIDFMQLAPGMCPADSQLQRCSVHASGFSQSAIASVSANMQDALETRQNVPGMLAIELRRIAPSIS